MTGSDRRTDLIQRPGACSPDQIDAFVELVSQGEQVRVTGLRERIVVAHWLGFHCEGDELAAVAAIKRPTENYRDKIFRKAAVDVQGGAPIAELGWVVTDAKFRGKGIMSELLHRLLDKADPCNLFATSRTDNSAMQRLLETVGFQETGGTFSGINGDHLLQLWVRCSPQSGS
jgi:GNAT superfamily N-acetyltransferase